MVGFDCTNCTSHYNTDKSKKGGAADDRSGSFQPGADLPADRGAGHGAGPFRRLAGWDPAALGAGTNPNTIQKAYQELENRGIIRSAAGRGSFVAGREAAQGILRAQAESSLREAAQKAVLAGLTREEAARLIDEAWKGEGKP